MDTLPIPQSPSLHEKLFGQLEQLAAELPTMPADLQTPTAGITVAQLEQLIEAW